MIDDATITAMIRTKLPDADVVVTDMTGTGDHLDVRIRSSGFSGMPLLDQHRLIYGALESARQDGRIHALQLKTEAK